MVSRLSLRAPPPLVALPPPPLPFSLSDAGGETKIEPGARSAAGLQCVRSGRGSSRPPAAEEEKAAKEGARSR